MQADTVVPKLLEEYGTIIRRALQRYLDVHGTRGAEYMGDAVREYPQPGGRSLRPSLCIATARAFGATVEDAVGSAVALELLHNAFLVHDDVEDDSDERRGRPTLHALHGVPIAVNVGDALTLLGLRALIDNRRRLGASLAMRILEETERMARETVEGQAVELGWRRDNAVNLSERDYLGMVLKKTCSYTTIYPSRVGALIGARDDVELDRLVRFGFFLGAAFQIQDDRLNLAGDPRRYGKELDGDIREGKRTLMLIHLLASAADDERVRLTEFLSRSRSERVAADVCWIRERMDHYGSLEYARQVAHALVGAAIHEFESSYAGVADSRDRDFVAELPMWVLERA